AARIALDGRVDEWLDFREGDDLVELPIDLPLSHAEHGAAQIDVLATRQIRMKPGADLEQATDTAEQLHAPRRRLRDPRDDLEQRALAGAVPADHAQHLAVLHVERDVAERPALLRRPPPGR